MANALALRYQQGHRGTARMQLGQLMERLLGRHLGLDSGGSEVDNTVTQHVGRHGRSGR